MGEHERGRARRGGEHCDCGSHEGIDKGIDECLQRAVSSGRGSTGGNEYCAAGVQVAEGRVRDGDL